MRRRVDQLRQVHNATSSEGGGAFLVDAGQVEQLRRVDEPALAHHLSQVHRRESRVQPAAVSSYVDHRLQDAQRLVEHRLEVRHIVTHRQARAAEVRLQQQLRLCVRRVEGAAVDVPWQLLRQRRVDALLVVPHRQLVVLGGGAQHAQQPRQLGRPLVHVVQLSMEERDGGVLEVVVRGDAAESERRDADAVVGHLEAAGVLEVGDGRLDERREEGGGAFLGRVGLVVVRRVLAEPAVEVGPREEVDGVLLRADRARDHLRVEVVVQLLLQLRLDREGLVEELLVEGLLGLVHEDHRDASVVELRPARAPHHLQHVSHREVDVPLRLGVVVLSALDHDEVRWEVDPPRQRGGAHEHVDRLREEEPLDEHAVRLLEPRVVDADPEGERVPQRRVAHAAEQRLELGGAHVEELRVPLVGGAVRDEVKRGEPGLPPRRDEDERRLVSRVVEDGAVRRLVHRCHARAVVLPGEAGDVHLERHRPHRRLEVEERVLRDAEPVGQVVGVGHRCREAHDPHGLAALLRHVPHPRHDDF
mmetsp:Transcript_19570/g.44986  ORF Transcript_19570/g.44986 Transcript_19570/m.44986 type:complete len:531 (-) Transcript_19570:1978-3570(-)